MVITNLKRAPKGWAKTLELPYRIDYNLKDNTFKKSMGLSDTGVMVHGELKKRRTPAPDDSDFTGRWIVTLREYKGPAKGQVYEKLGVYEKPEDALKKAQAYMAKWQI